MLEEDGVLEPCDFAQVRVRRRKAQIAMRTEFIVTSGMSAFYKETAV
jgi:hypothetical protein